MHVFIYFITSLEKLKLALKKFVNSIEKKETILLNAFFHLRLLINLLII